MSTPDEMKALIDSVAHDIVEHRWPHVDDEVFEELRQAHLDLAEKIVTGVLAALSAHPDAIPSPESDAYAAFEDWEQEMFRHQPVISMEDGRIAGCQCLDRVFVKGREDWGTHLALVITSRLALSAHPAEETVTTVEAAMSFDVIPRGTVVRSAAGTIACRYDERHGTVFGDERAFLWHELALPLTILWTPVPEDDDGRPVPEGSGS